MHKVTRNSLVNHFTKSYTKQDSWKFDFSWTVPKECLIRKYKGELTLYRENTKENAPSTENELTQ